MTARALAFVAVLTAWAPIGRADEAQQHLVRGTQLYGAGKYPEAVAELRAGYAIDPRPEFLYALGQVERKRGDCKAAIDYYQKFVATNPSAQRRAAVLLQIDRCQEELAAQKPAAKAPPLVAPPPQEPTPTPAPAVTAPLAAAPAGKPKTPAYRRWWVWTPVVLVAVGAGVGLGLGFGLTARSSFNPTLPDAVKP